jgi:secreted trypsin-like serine protease
MASCGSNRGRLWLVLMVALGGALVSLVTSVQWERPARAHEQGGRGPQIVLEDGIDPAFPRIEAARQGDFEAQIVGGTAVPNGKYPFMAFIEIETSAGLSACGGSLIDRDSVLTAAHCVHPSLVGNEIRVNLVVGRTVLSQNQGQVRFVTDAFRHPRYNSQINSSYDAAVLKLESAVTGIQPIKLATANQNNLENPGHKLTVAGWGTTSEGGNHVEDRMRQVRVPVVSDSRARRAYSSLPTDAEYFPSLMVAAGKKGKDSCQGDSGGPLFDSGSRTQVGITSTGYGCGRARYPGAYTEVNNPAIRRFIRDAARR